MVALFATQAERRFDWAGISLVWTGVLVRLTDAIVDEGLLDRVLPRALVVVQNAGSFGLDAGDFCRIAPDREVTPDALGENLRRLPAGLAGKIADPGQDLGTGEYRHDVVADAPRQSRRHVGNGQGAAQAGLSSSRWIKTSDATLQRRRVRTLVDRTRYPSGWRAFFLGARIARARFGLAPGADPGRSIDWAACPGFAVTCDLAER